MIKSLEKIRNETYEELESIQRKEADKLTAKYGTEEFRSQINRIVKTFQNEWYRRSESLMNASNEIEKIITPERFIR